MPALPRRALVPAAVLAAVSSLAVLPAAPSGAAYEPGEPRVEWSALSGSTGDDTVYGVDTYGSRTYAVGVTDTADSTATGLDGFLDVRGPNGQLLQSDPTGLTGFEIAYAVDAGPWGAVVAGWVDGAFPGETNAAETDVYVRRYAPDGSILWTTQVGDSSDPYYADDVLVTAGHVVVTGDVDTGASGSDGNRDAFALVLDLEDGAFQENRVVGFTSSVESGTGLAPAPSGFVVSGSTTGDLTDPTGPAGQDDGWLERYRLSSAGALTRVWSVQTRDAARDVIDDVVVSGDRVFYAGNRSTEPGKELALVGSVRLSTGASLWRRTGGTTDGRATAVVVGPQGPVVAGYAVGDVAGEPGTSGTNNAFVQGWSTAGRRLWTTLYPASAGGQTLATTLARSSAGLVVGGEARGRIFGDQTLAQDGFVALLQAQRPAARFARSGLSVVPGRTASTRLTLTNGGDAPDRLRLRGCASTRDVRVVVRQGSRDVSAAVRAGTYRTPTLAAGRSLALTVVVEALRNRTSTTRCLQTVTSGLQTRATGRAALRVVVRRR